MQQAPRPPADTTERQAAPAPPAAPFARAIGSSRFIVLLAVAAVLLVAVSLFVVGAIGAAITVWETFEAARRGDLTSPEVTAQYLEIVSVMLKAVIFYLVGVGFYSLFIAPLNLPTALGITTFRDLESKVISAIVTIMAVTFLQHFILWERADETLRFGAALALVVSALVAFQFLSHHAEQREGTGESPQERAAKHELFEQGQEAGRVSAGSDRQHAD
jgi:uncharacterized membrane protein YqhA